MAVETSKTPQYYRDRASACQHLADKAGSTEIRETMLYLATRWRVLADEDEAKQLLRPGVPEPLPTPVAAPRACVGTASSAALE
jgi:hypothetical protein